MKNRSCRRNHCVFLLLLTALGFGSCRDEEGKRHLDVLRQLALDTPVYQGFQLRPRPFENYKIRDAILVFGYRSNAHYNDVKRYYSEILIAKGWSTPEEVPLGGLHSQDAVELIFRKGEYQIVVGYEGPEQDSSGSNYSLGFQWERR